jgi:hypothetical protein
MGKVIVLDFIAETYDNEAKNNKKSQCRHTGREKTSVMIITVVITDDLLKLLYGNALK